MYLLAVLVVVCGLYPDYVHSQCTTKHCNNEADNLDTVTDMSSVILCLHQQLTEQQQQLIEQQATIQLLQQQQTKFEEILTKPEDCADLLRNGHTRSGVYDVYPREAGRYIQVYCDMETDGRRWLAGRRYGKQALRHVAEPVVQRRQDGSVDFYRDWVCYKEGFGDVSGEFWLGNDNLHDITASKRYELRFDIEDFNNVTKYAKYTYFTVASECDKYRIAFGAYNGTAGDSMAIHAGQQFSTKDRDNDIKPSASCAVLYRGAWWYARCFDVNINGLYLGNKPDPDSQGVAWERWHAYYSFKTVDMKLRPAVND
ncbi:Ficolin-2 [Lamellibrachia satsuma]|nr:Ficolin-2 [Lamellibrachia satsuma]